jgi:hypothetical protein
LGLGLDQEVFLPVQQEGADQKFRLAVCGCEFDRISGKMPRTLAFWCARRSIMCDVAAADHREEQIDDMVAILAGGISRTMEDLRREGVWRG